METIVDHYVKNRGFLGLRNCGKKTNCEIINLCKKHIDKRNDKKKIEIPKENKKIAQFIENADEQQTNVINCILIVKFKKLSKEAQKSFESFVGQKISLKTIKDKFFLDPFFSICTLPGSNKRIVHEADKFLKETIRLINSISVIEQSFSKRRNMSITITGRNKRKIMAYIKNDLQLPIVNVVSKRNQKQ